MCGMHWGERLQNRLDELGWSIPRLAAEMGREGDQALLESLSKYVLQKVDNPRGTMLADIAKAVDMSETELRTGTKLTARGVADSGIVGNALIGGAVSLTHRIPAYGHAMGGRHGEFVLNGNKIADLLAPPELVSVPNAYAVYIAGSSMENRYFAGEVAFVHPGLPVKKGDFVVAQIATKKEDGSPPLAYVKRFVSMDDKRLRLEQFNPKKTLDFPAKSVVSVHKILMAGTV